MIDRIEKALDAVLPAADARPVVLSQAIRWAVDGGGKRIRPQVCMMAAVAAGGREEDAVWPACAIELLHSYTLVHDDLPAMDNDTMRRGRASVWAKFGEANAILAGDALQALAFSVAARSPHAAEITAVLSRAASAVVEGQVEDIEGVNGLKSGACLEELFLKKTASLFAAAAEMGALATGASAEVVDRLCTFGREIGMAFQYEDDLLDGDCGEDGGFSSLPLLGRKVLEHRIATHTSAAKVALDGLPGEISPLASLAARLAVRTA